MAKDLRHGLSYRPDGAAHEDALGAAAAHELLRQRRERELRAQLRPKVAPRCVLFLLVSLLFLCDEALFQQ